MPLIYLLGQTLLKTSCYFHGQCEQQSDTMRRKRAVKDHFFIDEKTNQPRTGGNILA